MRTMIRSSAAAILAVSLGAAAPAMAADAVEQFYAGKTIHLVIGFGPGGGYDVYGRVLARYLGRHIPGNPTIVPQNMPGAGSLRSAGWLYNAAAKDGTVIATFARGIAMDALLDSDNRQFDARKFSWLGSVTNEVSVCAFGRTSGIATWNDMLTKEYSIGSSGLADDAGVYANVIKRIFRAKLKLVPGYPGTADILLAVERGELAGLCGWSWSTLKSRSKGLYDSGAVKVAVQLGLSPHEDLAGVPLIMDQTKDLTDLAALRLIFSRQTMARPFAAPPGIPADRKQALQAAFEATMKDPEFLDEARRLDLEVRPVSGAEIENLVTELYKSPPEIIKLATEAVRGGP